MKNKKDIFIMGTRPEIIKMASIILKIDQSERIILHTGQHKELAEEAFKTFGISPDIKLDLMTENQDVMLFVSKCLESISNLQLTADDISRIWVQGDTATAFAGALTGKFLKIPVVHVEAGLRTHDMLNPWPEEMFRTEIDNISDILLAPTETSKRNLKNIPSEKIFVTGNTIVDALESIKEKLPTDSPYEESYVLATIHRRESFGDRMIEIFEALKELSKKIKVVIPAHPNPNVRKALKQVGLDYIKPLSYHDFLHHLKFCEYVITDSGGVQEEAPSFQKRTVVLREKTERVEAITAELSVLVNQLTKENILQTIKDFTSRPVGFTSNPFGDGHASDRIINLRNNSFSIMNDIFSKKVCVFSLTYNRPDYIKRSFDSLYARAGIKFDHYVFDDCSDEETTEMLQLLQKKYSFKLFQNRARLGIFKNFHMNVRAIPKEYDFYVKFDSDVEILSDNLLFELIEVFNHDNTVCGATPRVEGVYGTQRIEHKHPRVDFYNGHVIKLDAPVMAGCCLMFSKQAFETVKHLTDKELTETVEKWAVDSLLYEHSLKFGKFVTVEDLSVYHIDNSYGQRKRDMRYFIERNRWGTIDIDEIWYLRLSKDIYPTFLGRPVLELLKRSSNNDYDMFLKSCKSTIEHGILETEKPIEITNIIQKIKDSDMPKMTMYKIFAPVNFVASKNMKKEEIRYYEKLPDWCKHDPGVVVEKIKMSVSDAMQVAYKEPLKSK